MKIPGDKIEITIILSDTKLKDNLIISYIEKDKIITCGHCLPPNSKLDIGNIIYTSGFDIPGEEEELGLIRIKSEYINNYKNEIDNKQIKLNDGILEYNTPIFNYYNRKKIYGKILNYQKEVLIKGFNFINSWIYDHQINKLQTPYYLIKGCTKTNDSLIYRTAKDIFSEYIFADISFYENKIFKLTKQGYSGSPWIKEDKDIMIHIGIHIGKTIGIFAINNKVIEISEIAYVKPI